MSINSCAGLLIVIQNDMKIMPDRSNIFISFWNGDGWEEFEFSQV